MQICEANAATHTAALRSPHAPLRPLGTATTATTLEVLWEPGTPVAPLQLPSLQLRPLRAYSVGDVVAWQAPPDPRAAAAVRSPPRPPLCYKPRARVAYWG